MYNEKEIRENYRNLTNLLIKRNLTITTMESATSGQIASLITDTEGSSAVFKGAYITYANETKILCGVSLDVIEKYSVYSLETAEAMAAAAQKAFDADIAVGITGTMGNTDLENAEASTPGEVFFAIRTDCIAKVFHIQLPPQPTRLMYKLAVAQEIYESLIDIISEV